jgi:2'-5' RNA ligase
LNDPPPERANGAVRAFVALDLDPECVRAVERLQNKLLSARRAPDAAWVPADKMHVTLKFIGALDPANVDAVALGLMAAVGERPPPPLGAPALDAFPAISHARVVVVVFEDPTGQVTQLAQEVDRLAEQLGVPPEQRAFRPHVTLARLRRPVDASRWLRGEPVDASRWLRSEPVHSAAEWLATGVTLYRSVLGPKTSKYIPLVSYSFS